jgi:very-short-patch-repair endonuclease
LLDFAFPDIRLCVEADGDYWHSIPGAKERDCNRDQTLARCGWTTLRFSETKINASTEQCVDEIARVIQDLKNSAHL